MQLTTIFQHVQFRRDNFEIISRVLLAAEINLFRSETWLHVKENTEISLKFFQNNFVSHVTTLLDALLIASLYFVGWSQ